MHRYELTPRQRRPRNPENERTATLWRGALSGVSAFAVLAFLGIGLLLIGYALIVSDLPAPSDDETLCSQHYVGLSRARSVLSLIYRDYAD